MAATGCHRRSVSWRNREDIFRPQGDGRSPFWLVSATYATFWLSLSPAASPVQPAILVFPSRPFRCRCVSSKIILGLRSSDAVESVSHLHPPD